MIKLILLAIALMGGPAAANSIDHGPFGLLLEKNVKGDTVDYSGFKGPELGKYLAVLAATDPSKLSKKGQLALWINAYNAYTIAEVVKKYPKIKSVQTASGPDFAFFKVKVATVGGKKYSLNNIENDIIRPTFGDPRIHAAVNCASVSCPPLANFAFTEAKLDAQLDQMMNAFVNDDARNAISAKGVKLSKILEWYGKDFEKAGGVKAYLLKRLTDPAKKAALEKAKLGFMPYDWNLNAAK